MAMFQTTLLKPFNVIRQFKSTTFRQLLSNKLPATAYDRRATYVKEPDKKLTYEVTVQPDVTNLNLHEILEIIQRDQTMPHLRLSNENVLRTMTAHADRPWFTARDKNGTLLGFCIVTRVGESYARCDRAFVTPEVRGHGIASTVLNVALEDVLRGYPDANFQGFARRSQEGGAVLDNVPYGKRDGYINSMHICMSVPEKYNKNDFPDKGDDFDIVPYARGRLFDKIVQYDTAKVHEIPRPLFLKMYFNPRITNGYVAVDKQSGDVVGYGGIQDTFHPTTQLIGPMYAENGLIAEVLFRKLMEHHKPGNAVSFFCYEENVTMKKILDKTGIEPLETLTEEYTKFHFPIKYNDQVYIRCPTGLCCQ